MEKNKVLGMIAYKIKEGHKDAPASDEIEFYEDVFTISGEMTDGDAEYIYEELKLVAGGGYDWEYIKVIEMMIKPLTSL